jgi:hypothetical protein
VRYLTSSNFYDFFCSGGGKEIALAISSLDVMIQNRFQVKGLSALIRMFDGVFFHLVSPPSLSRRRGFA